MIISHIPQITRTKLSISHYSMQLNDYKEKHFRDTEAVQHRV